MAALDPEAVAAAMRAFEGEIQQQPPPYSAKKVQGVKFYELARRGEEVPAEPKEVTVYEFSPWGRSRTAASRFRLACSSGTYARGLAHDLGVALGVGAHLSELRRTRIGTFQVDDAVAVAPPGSRGAGRTSPWARPGSRSTRSPSPSAR